MSKNKTQINVSKNRTPENFNKGLMKSISAINISSLIIKYLNFVIVIDNVIDKVECAARDWEDKLVFSSAVAS